MQYPKAGRARAVLEDMSEMAPASAAMHFGAGHEMAAVNRGRDRPVLRLEEARPPGPALILRGRVEELLAAAGARERPLALLLVERARAGALGSVLPEHLKLLRRELLLPLFVGLGDGVVGHGSSRLVRSTAIRAPPVRGHASMLPPLRPGRESDDPTGGVGSSARRPARGTRQPPPDSPRGPSARLCARPRVARARAAVLLSWRSGR